MFKKKKVNLLFFSTACPKGIVSSLDIFVNALYGWMHLLRGFESLFGYFGNHNHLSLDHRDYLERID